MLTSQLRTLGAYEFVVDGRVLSRPSTQKARALLAYLAMRAGCAISREVLIETFWPDVAPESARQSLKTALWSIRRTIREGGFDPSAFLTADHFTVCWRAAIEVDALAFEQRAAAGDATALSVFAGDFLPGDYDQWASSERERLRALLEALLSASLERDGDVASARRLLQLDPFSEAAYATLIEVEVREQRIAAARTLLGCFRATLRENGLTASDAFERRFAALADGAHVAPMPARFIGRARELHRFDDFLREAGSDPIVVRADAGFGKTTLLERFVRRAAEAGRTTVWVTIGRTASGFGGWERAYEALTGAPFESLLADRGASLGGALAQAIVRAVPSGGLIFVDDAQHLQGDALFVTRAVYAAARAAGIATVIATRPEGVPVVFDILGSANVVEMALEAFTAAELHAVLAGDASAGTLADTVFARTHGHPLYVHRVLERMREGELHVELPDSVRALIDSRLRERGADAHALAALLALDPAFDGDELAAILEWSHERVFDALDDLLALGIVRESAASARLEFTHDVIVEVARESLGPARRRRHHRIAARLLESASGRAQAARAAEHAAAAGDAAKAAELFRHCSESALAAFEPGNAAVLAGRAREQLRSLDRTDEVTRLGLRIDVAEIRALNAAADPLRAQDLATAAIALARTLDDPRLLFELVSLRLRARMRTAAVAEIAEDARLAMALAERLGDRTCFAQAALGALQAAMQRMDEGQAAHYAELALQAAIDGDDVDLAIFVASECLHAQAVFWRFQEAMQTFARGQALLRDGSGATSPSFYYSAAQLMYGLDRYEEAAHYVELGLSVLDARRPAPGPFISDRLRVIAILTNMRGLIAVASARWEAACDAADAFGANPAAQNPGVYPHAVDLWVRSLLGRNGPGDVARAAQLLAGLGARALVDDTTMYVAAARARVAARQGDPEAPALLDAALACTLATAGKAGLDVDMVFADLASAAREAGAEAIAARAAALGRRYRGRRRRAAGVYWGPALRAAPSPVL